MSVFKRPGPGRRPGPPPPARLGAIAGIAGLGLTALPPQGSGPSPGPPPGLTALPPPRRPRIVLGPSRKVPASFPEVSRQDPAPVPTAPRPPRNRRAPVRERRFSNRRCACGWVWASTARQRAPTSRPHRCPWRMTRKQPATFSAASLGRTFTRNSSWAAFSGSPEPVGCWSPGLLLRRGPGAAEIHLLRCGLAVVF